ncbi:uncharacterized protein [Periplaneta americana]|uniref:uncharacterized protein n=1 Tax=Periplaneta americana TaxID=6978 RepID=UPI0037E7B42D
MTARRKSKALCVTAFFVCLVAVVTSDEERELDSSTKMENYIQEETGGSEEVGHHVNAHASKNVNLSENSVLKNVNSFETEDPDKTENQTETEKTNEATDDNSWSFWDALYEHVGVVLSECIRLEDEDDESSPTVYTGEKRLLNCLKNSARRDFEAVLKGNVSKVSVLPGRLELEWRSDRQGRSRAQDALDVLTDWDGLSRRLSLRVKIIPGLFLKMWRREDGFQVGVQLDESDVERLEGRGGNRKKLKKLKKFLPLLLIPVALQFVLLPMVLSGLKMMATKALMAGKLALLLVLFNAAYGALVPQHDEYNTRVANDAYGYDGGVEYGAFVNRRNERDRRDLAYRGHR